MPRTDKATEKIVKRVVKIAKKYGVDPQSIDFKALIDPKLTESENLSAIYQHILMLIPDEEKKIEFREKYLGEKTTVNVDKAKRLQIEKIAEYNQKLRERYYETLEERKNTDIFQEYNQIYGKRIERVFQSKRTHLLIVYGAGGVGKSTFVSQKAIDYFGKNGVLKTKGYISEKGLFLLLQKLSTMEKGVLILDNMEETIFTNNYIRSLLEQATEKEETREVFRITGETLESDTGLGSVTLKETHKIVIITNHYKDDDPKIQALKTRAVVIHIDAQHSHKFGEALLIKEIGKENAERIKNELSRLRVYHLLTLRDFVDIIDMFQTFGKIDDVIEECKLTFFEKNAYLKKAYEIYNEYKAHYGKEAIAKWVAETGLSGRTYKNYVRTLRILGIIKTDIDIEKETIESETLGKLLGKSREKCGKNVGN